jgi:hypothetical protein
MIDLTCALFFSIPLLLLLAALSFLPSYIARQNQKTFDILRDNQDLTRAQIDNDRKKEKEKTMINIKLQAYERMTLFLERIKLSNLLTRVSLPGQTVGDLQAMLLRSLREEYEHNMSQQLYISDATWELIKTAKEEVVRLINVAATKIRQDEEGALLARELLTSDFKQGKNPIDQAMAGLKKDMQDSF